MVGRGVRAARKGGCAFLDAQFALRERRVSKGKGRPGDAARAGSVPNGGEGGNASLAKVAFFAMIRATSDARTYV